MSGRIGDLVEVPAVQTVIRLEYGRTEARRIADAFVFTSEVGAHVAVLAELLSQDHGRGCFIQGNFGSGKSHFLAALAAWLNRRDGWQVLSERHSGLARLAARGRRLLAVEVSLVDYRGRTPLESILIHALNDQLQAQTGTDARLTPMAVFLGGLRDVLEAASALQSFCDAQQLVAGDLDEWFRREPKAAYGAALGFLRANGLAAPEALVEDRRETVARAMRAVRTAGYDGVVFLIDELSEFFRSKPTAARLNEDARVLQFLGEFAADEPLWVVAAVQESIERTGDIAQSTFRKIKDRFPQRFQLSTLHIRDLISRRLVKHRPGAAARIRAIHDAYAQHFATFDAPLELFLRTYPVHPATLTMLEGLGDLFSQHRGIVDFVHAQIAGDPDRGIDGILQRADMEMLAPDAIYEHFRQRLAEFSAFNIFPQRIVPHLDAVIDRCQPEADDRVLARRLVRILVLYAIHPTAEPPAVRRLTELTACAVTTGEPALNARFVAEAILEPIAAESRFLVCRQAPADTAERVYAVVSEEDHRGTLEARLARIAADLDGKDRRLMTTPLAELSESASWPGPQVLNGTVSRAVQWRNSSRDVCVLLETGAPDATARRQIEAELRSGAIGAALVLRFDTFSLDLAHATEWIIGRGTDDDNVLRDYLAARLLAAELKPSNPADQPLIPMLEERLERLQPVAQQAALQAIFDGHATGTEARLEPAARQVRRFDRLLEFVAAPLLEARYPLYKDIAATGLAASPRLYQSLLDDFVAPGSISLRDARTRGLTQVIEALATPLGLVEVKGGTYRLAPDPDAHPVVKTVFAAIPAASTTPLDDVLQGLCTGPYGMPRNTACFLLLALAHSGMVALLNHGRTTPVEFLRMAGLTHVDAVAPGELLDRGDRETLLRECAFLAPAAGWPTFGLRQQREAWQALLRWREKSHTLLDQLHTAIGKAAAFAAFEHLDRERLDTRLAALTQVTDEIKISYPARDGLERFLRAWRGAGLTAGDLEWLRHMRNLLADNAEQLVFLHHYLRHRAVTAAIATAPDLAVARDAVMALIERPEEIATTDGGRMLNETFATFRGQYQTIYAAAHARHNQALAGKRLDRFGKRAFALLRRLSAIGALDRPPGSMELRAALERPREAVCARRVEEELVRTPVCGCGFVIGDRAPPAVDPAVELERVLREYAAILRQPPVIEALTARAYALRDARPQVAASLRTVTDMLKAPQPQPLTALLDHLDETTTGEMAEALSRRVRIEERCLAELVRQLAGRRLALAEVRRIVDQWLGDPGKDGVLAITGAGGADVPARDADGSWWALLRADLLPDEVRALGADPAWRRRLEEEVVERYPAVQLREKLAHVNLARLWRFMVEEPCHAQAVREAWCLAARRVLDDEDPPTRPPTPAFLRPALADTLRTRLATLQAVGLQRQGSCPDRLCARLSIVEIATDPWATPELQRHADDAVNRLAASAEDWLTALPPVSVRLAPRTVIVIVDAIPPDVWLRVTTMTPALFHAADMGWERLVGEAATVSGMAARLGTAATVDPTDDLAARAIPFHQLDGRESRSFADIIDDEAVIANGCVLRLNAFDRGAHAAALSLTDMSAALAAVLERQLPPLLSAGSPAGRVVLTGDHGLSWRRGALSHGRGGVFDRAIFIAEWHVQRDGEG